VALSRLTVRQYRNAVTDLVGSFRNGGKPEERRGLRGEYFKARDFQSGNRLIDRVDPEVRFDFGTSSPMGQVQSASVYHPLGRRHAGSGHRGVRFRRPHRTRAPAWNDSRHPLIDAWVKSGKDTEYRGTIFLLGGRVYPIRLEFTKSTQGVDDTEKLKNRPVLPASIVLAWKRPKQAD